MRKIILMILPPILGGIYLAIQAKNPDIPIDKQMFIDIIIYIICGAVPGWSLKSYLVDRNYELKAKAKKNVKKMVP